MYILKMHEIIACPKAQALEGLRATDLAQNQAHPSREGWCRKGRGRTLRVVCS